MGGRELRVSDRPSAIRRRIDMLYLEQEGLCAACGKRLERTIVNGIEQLECCFDFASLTCRECEGETTDT